jgi:hypothetical protein
MYTMTVQYGSRAVTETEAVAVPLTVAVTVLRTADVPTVQVGTVTVPSAPVVATELTRLPPPAVTANLTVAPAIGLAPLVTRKTGAVAAKDLTRTVCPDPETSAIAGVGLESPVVVVAGVLLHAARTMRAAS